MKRALLACCAALVVALWPCAPASAQRWPRGDPDAVIHAVLAQPAYRTAVTDNRPPDPTIWETLWKWIVDRVRDLLKPLRGLYPGVRSVGTGFGIAILIGAGVGLLIIAVRLLTPLARRSAPARSPLPGEVLLEEHSSRTWRALAAQAAARGDYQAAISALFLAALRLLDECGVLGFDAARTPGEYRRFVQHALGRAAPAFDGLASSFVHAAYAAQPPGRDEYETAAGAYATFAPLVGTP